MPKPRHPLVPLSVLRRELTDEAVRGLGRALGVAGAAGRAVAGEHRAREALARERDVVTTGTRHELERGELRAFDLALASGWAVGAAGREARADEALGRARERLRAAEGEVDEARGRAAAARADADVVERLLEKDAVAD